MSWSIEWGAAGGGALTNLEHSFPLYFVKRLNGVGLHSCLLNNPSSKPQVGELVRFVWDRGNSGETTHFEGFITDVRRKEETNTFLCRGLDLNGLLWQSTTGDVRDYDSTTPYNILTQSGTPNGLIFNSQGNRKPIGSTTVQYASDGTDPNQIDSSTTGDSLTFRADSGRTLVNIQRLLLQGRATGDYPSWVDSGDAYGLEGYVRLTGSNNDEPRLFVVTRREPSTNATPTTLTYPQGFQDFKRGSEGLTASDAIRVVGGGSGFSRTESSLIGSGGIEGIITDKTVVDSTAASNQANRLQTLLDPSTDVVSTVTGEHYRAWTPGHRYTLEFPNTSNATQRLFTVSYVVQEEAFKLVFGRPRPLPNDPFRSVEKLAGGHAQGAQVTDLRPQSAFTTDDVDEHIITIGSGSTTFSSGQTRQTTQSPGDLPTDFAIGEMYQMSFQVRMASGQDKTQGDSHTHSYDRISSISDANSGNAGSDPHSHSFSTTSDTTGTTTATPTMGGPWFARLFASVDTTGNGSADEFPTLGQATFGLLEPGETLFQSAGFPFSIMGSDDDLIELTFEVTSHADYSVTLNGDLTRVFVRKNPLHNHNA